MGRKMLINALHAEEARVAIVEDGRLVDLDVEIAGSEQIRGNIYRGVVVRVEPGLQAAFVDVGLKKLGFLQMGEIHPENYRWRDDIPEEQRHRRPRIQEVLRRGQELIVQVEKGERDNKGSALTTYISLPGRYMVLMPGSDSAGISRKVEAEGERKKLKEIISEMIIPEGYGYIIRTEAMGRTREELQKDLDSLIALYEGVRSQGAAMKGAGLIYQESALIIRTIRDYFSADIDEVLVDSKDVYKDVRECLKEIDPQFEKLVKMHQEKRPIFSRYQLEEQIDLIYEKKVPLKSGGSIFIEPTEALVSIDVNSGKSTGEKGVEDTAFKTNLEAAEEAARQLRLRDLGGLIVIDFIDMRDRKHNIEVEKTLKSALKVDKARVNVSRISEFGLLEMSRQRIRQTLNQASTLECPHCDGRGKVKSVEAMALSFLRKVHAAAAKGTTAEVVGSLPLEVAYYLLNRKRRELSRIESDYDIEVTVKGKPSYLLNQMELELVKREKLPQEELPQEKAAAHPPVKEEALPHEGAPAEGRKKRKKGKKAHPEAEVAVEAVAASEGALPEAAREAAPVEIPAPDATAAEVAAALAEGVPVALAVEPGGAERIIVEGEHEEQKKKRRRKRRRGKGGAEAAVAGEHLPEHPAEPVVVAVDLPAPAEAPAVGVEPHAEHPAEHAGEHPGEEGKKKRRRRRRRGKGHEAAAHEAVSGVPMQQEGGVLAQEAVMTPEEITPEAAIGQAAEPAALIPAGEAAAQAPEGEHPATEGAPAGVEPAAAAPAKKGRGRRGKKPAAEAALVEAPAVVAEAVPVAGEPLPVAPTLPVAPETAAATGEAPVVAPAEEETKPKGKRSRGKRGAKGGEVAPPAAAEGTTESGEGVALPEEPSAIAEAAPTPAEKPKRKRSRKGKGAEGSAAAAETAAAPEAIPAETAPAAEGEAAVEAAPPAELPAALTPATHQEPATPASGETVAAEVPGETAAPEAAAEPAAAAEAAAEESGAEPAAEPIPVAAEPEPVAVEQPAAKARAKRPRKTPAPAEAPAEEKPKKPRAPRKKKEETPK